MFKSIAKNLVPENYKSNKFIMDVLDVFVDYIYDNSSLAIDINNLYNSKNEVLYEEIIKTYAANFYKTITDGSKNHKLAEAVRKAHEKYGFDFSETQLDINVIHLLSQEQLELFKNFQQSKGTLRSIEFIYRIIEQLNIESFVLETDGQLTIEPGENIFEYRVYGSMLPEIFEAFVKPLAHPVGWTYLFTRTYVLKFEDYFLCKEVYDVNVFRVTCEDSDCEDNFKTNTGYLFETDINNNIIYENNKPKMYKANGNPVFNVTRFGVNYPELTLESELKLVKDPTIRTIEKSSIKGNDKLVVYFESGERLEQNSNPKNLILYYYKGINALNQEIKKDYTDFLSKCALELNYVRRVVTTVKDKYQFQVDFGLASTTGKFAAIGAGNMYLGSDTWVLGKNRIDTNTPVTYGTRVRNKVLQTSDFKALYKKNDNSIRQVFDKVYSGFDDHIKSSTCNFILESDNLYHYRLYNPNAIFFELINTYGYRVRAKIKYNDDSLEVIAEDELKNTQLLYIDKTLFSKYGENIYKDFKESLNKPLGQYYVVLKKGVNYLNIVDSNGYIVKGNYRLIDSEYRLYLNTKNPVTLQFIDDTYEYDSRPFQIIDAELSYNNDSKLYEYSTPQKEYYFVSVANHVSNVDLDITYVAGLKKGFKITSGTPQKIRLYVIDNTSKRFPIAILSATNETMQAKENSIFLGLINSNNQYVEGQIIYDSEGKLATLDCNARTQNLSLLYLDYSASIKNSITIKSTTFDIAGNFSEVNDKRGKFLYNFRIENIMIVNIFDKNNQRIQLDYDIENTGVSFYTDSNEAITIQYFDNIDEGIPITYSVDAEFKLDTDFVNYNAKIFKYKDILLNIDANTNKYVYKHDEMKTYPLVVMDTDGNVLDVEMDILTTGFKISYSESIKVRIYYLDDTKNRADVTYNKAGNLDTTKLLYAVKNGVIVKQDIDTASTEDFYSFSGLKTLKIKKADLKAVESNDPDSRLGKYKFIKNIEYGLPVMAGFNNDLKFKVNEDSITIYSETKKDIDIRYVEKVNEKSFLYTYSIRKDDDLFIDAQKDSIKYLIDYQYDYLNNKIIFTKEDDDIVKLFFLKNKHNKKTILSINNANFEDIDFPIKIYLNDDFVEFKDKESMQLDINPLNLKFNQDIKNRNSTIRAINKNLEVLEQIDFNLAPQYTFKALGDYLYEIDFNKIKFKENKLNEESLWYRESSVYHNHYVGYFTANNVQPTQVFTGISNKLDYELRETNSWGLTAIDTFEITGTAASDGFDVNFEFIDSWPEITEVYKNDYTGFYQNKWGWQSGYVDVYQTTRDLERFNEKYERLEHASIYQMDDYIVIGSNDITKDYMFKWYPTSKSDDFSDSFLRNGQVSEPVTPNKIYTGKYDREPDNIINKTNT